MNAPRAFHHRTVRSRRSALTFVFAALIVGLLCVIALGTSGCLHRQEDIEIRVGVWLGAESLPLIAMTTSPLLTEQSVTLREFSSLKDVTEAFTHGTIDVALLNVRAAAQLHADAPGTFSYLMLQLDDTSALARWEGPVDLLALREKSVLVPDDGISKPNLGYLLFQLGMSDRVSISTSNYIRMPFELEKRRAEAFVLYDRALVHVRHLEPAPNIQEKLYSKARKTVFRGGVAVSHRLNESQRQLLRRALQSSTAALQSDRARIKELLASKLNYETLDAEHVSVNSLVPASREHIQLLQDQIDNFVYQSTLSTRVRVREFVTPGAPSSE